MAKTVREDCKAVLAKFEEYSDAGVGVLLMAIDMSAGSWKLGFASKQVGNPRIRTLGKEDKTEEGLAREIKEARKRLGLPEDAPVFSCYEAGRDGFWPHRLLTKLGVLNFVVDSSSIKVNRRSRQNKTDRLDTTQLLVQLDDYLRKGDRRDLQPVAVPSEEEEDHRQSNRTLETVKADRTRAVNRIRSSFASQGIRWRGSIAKLHKTGLDGLKLWSGAPLPEGLLDRLQSDLDNWKRSHDAVHAVEKKREAQVRSEQRRKKDQSLKKVFDLMQLRGVGIQSASVLTMEALGWRKFRNRREVGGYSGLTDTFHSSGNTSRGQGISKASSRRVRATMIELAWCWIRFQPDSALTKWWESRFASNGARLRRTGIVAVARKLLIALWKYVETGEIPEGATLKASV